MTTICGRARLGGIPIGIILPEMRTVSVTHPADPADSDSKETTIQQVFSYAAIVLLVQSCPIFSVSPCVHAVHSWHDVPMHVILHLADTGQALWPSALPLGAVPVVSVHAAAC